MDVFILNSLGIYSPQIHSALKAVGANQLVHLLEAAIPLARSGPTEFKRSPDRAWFDKFPLTTEFAELHLVNRVAIPLVDALPNLVAAYIRLNSADIFED